MDILHKIKIILCFTEAFVVRNMYLSKQWVPLLNLFPVYFVKTIKTKQTEYYRNNFFQ